MNWTSYAHPITGLGAAMLCAVSVAAQQSTPIRDLSLDSLLSTRISTASKYVQTAAEAPASVTIVTSDDIRQFGYRGLQDVLESVPGFYASNDRDYPYIGTRGFGRPTDYNDRILLLVDGQTLNEQTWGAAMVGSDFPINLDAIERIEVVRGPGSAMYGTSAMFAVVNIITKTGTELDGVSVSGRLGTGRTRQLAMTAGHALGTRGAIATSGLLTHSDGNDLYYPDYDTPATNFGVTRGTDWERGIGGMASLSWSDFNSHVGYRSRTKGIPTGSFGTTFGDPRTSASDETLWGQVGAHHDFGPLLQLSARAYGERYRYRGVYPSSGEPGYTDGGGSTDLGGEALVVWEGTSRNRLTVGSEIRRVFRATYFERFTDGTLLSDNAPFTVASLFAENEFQLFPKMALFTGLRLDENSRGHDGLSPRLAVVATPDKLTTIKLLYGQAFRQPSTAEAEITTSFYTPNPSLKPERISTFELDVQRRVGTPFLVGASLYQYQLHDLIDQIEIDSTGLQYRNINASEAVGVELLLDALPDGPLSGHLSYALQRVENEPGDTPVTNSPTQVARLAIITRGVAGLRSAVALRYESGRRTLAGPATRAFVRTDVNLGYSPPASMGPGWLHGAETSLRITNLFNVAYATPGGLEHKQSSIAQDGRTLQLRFDWRL
ncbi:MAG: TonB-dependent receptor [bacterium]